MHVNVQLRTNPQTGDRVPYYRLKESYRDVRGNVHSLIVLNNGFEPNRKEKPLPLPSSPVGEEVGERLNCSLIVCKPSFLFFVESYCGK